MRVPWIDGFGVDRFSEVTLGDIGRGLARYRPAAITVVAIIMMAAFLPGERARRGPLTATPPPAFAPAPAAPPAAAAGGDPAFTADAGTGEFAVQPSGTFTTASSFSSSSGAPAASFAGDEKAAAPDADIAKEPGGFAADEPKPLKVTARLYASLGSETPLATRDVPERSLPVGNRVGQEDKRSYVRLAGSERELRLTEAAGGRETRGPPLVQACQVTDANWAEGEGVAFSAAPKFDAASCVLGARASDGGWSFDLSGFSDPTDQRGIALTVAPGAGFDFQVNLAEIP